MSDRITRAVILAAGRGTRMGGLTEDTPKPMLIVQGKPILQHIIEGLVEQGISEVLIVVGWKKDVIMDHFSTGEKFNVDVQYVVQKVQDGTGRVVELAKNYVGEQPFLLCCGDILVNAQTYAPLLEMKGAAGILTVKEGEDLSKGGAVKVKDGKVVDIIEKGDPSGGEVGEDCYYNAAVYAFSAKIFEYTAKLELSPRGEYELTDAIVAMAQDHEVRAEFLQGEWADVRDPEVLSQLNDSK